MHGVCSISLLPSSPRSPAMSTVSEPSSFTLTLALSSSVLTRIADGWAGAALLHHPSFLLAADASQVRAKAVLLTGVPYLRQ